MQVLGWDKDTQTGASRIPSMTSRWGLQQAQQFIAQGADVVMPSPVCRNGCCGHCEGDKQTLIVGVDSDWYETNPSIRRSS